MNTLQQNANLLHTKQQNSLTFDELFKEWIKNSELKETTIQHYKSRYYSHMSPFIGHMPVFILTEKDIIRIIKDIEAGKTVQMAKKPSPGAPLIGGINVAKACLTPLRKMLDYAVSIGEVEENVAKNIKFSQIDNKVPRAIARTKAKAPIHKVTTVKNPTYLIAPTDTSPPSPLIHNIDCILKEATIETTLKEFIESRAKQKISIVDTSPYTPKIEEIANIGREIREFAKNKGMVIIEKNGEYFVRLNNFLKIGKQKYGVIRTASTMRNLKYKGEGPESIKIDGKIWYRISSLSSWLYEIMEKDK